MLDNLLSKFTDMLPQIFRPKDTFNRACRAPTPSNFSSAALIEAIKLERPDLKDAMFYSPSYGHSSHTLFVGDEVFKGPTGAGDMMDFRKECRIMTGLKGQNLPVPELTTMGEKAPFYGMKRVQGVVLSEIMGQMTEPEKNQLACDMASFVVGFGKAFEKDAPDYNYLKENARKAVQAMASDTARQIFGNDYEWCKKEVTDYAARVDARGVMMMHGDLHTENILVDPVTKKMVAVIDFGITEYRHPEIDHVLVQSTFDDKFSKKVWGEYVRQQTGTDIKDFECNKFCYKLAEMKGKLEYATSHDLVAYYQPQLQEMWRAVKEAPQLPMPKPAPAKGATP